MLVLSRFAGEAVYVSGTARIEVASVVRGAATFLVTGIESPVRLEEGMWYEPWPGVKFKLIRTEPRKVRLGFDAPPAVEILRSELVDGYRPPVRR